MQSVTDGALCHSHVSFSIIIFRSIEYDFSWRVLTMHIRVSRHLPPASLHQRRLMLLVFWGLGTILGIAFSYCSQPLLPLMRRTVSSSVSIVGLGAVLFLPYLLTVSAVLFSRTGILLGIAFVKPLFFCMCAAAIDQAFGDAGWIIRFLLLFSDTASLPVLFWLIWRCLDGSRSARMLDFIPAAGILVMIGLTDYFLIAPFLDSVI